MPTIFISHTHTDKKISDAINEAIVNLFGNKMVRVVYSTKEDDGGIPHGNDWYEWIVEQVKEADIALILLTPNSIKSPWILWEAGAIEGIALATNYDKNLKERRKVRPITFDLQPEDIPSPFHRIQTISGDKREDVIKFLIDLISQFKNVLDNEFEAGMRLEKSVNKYMESIRASLFKIAIFANQEEYEDIKNMLIEAKFFVPKNIIRIETGNNSFKKAESITLLLVHYHSCSNEFEKILNLKKDTDALIIYAPAKDGYRIPNEVLKKISLESNTTIVNFRGRLLNEIYISLMTTNYSHNV